MSSLLSFRNIEGMKRYKTGQTIESGPYEGFIVVAVSNGWYKAYHPSNVNESCSIKEATTSIRWSWADDTKRIT